MKRLIKVLSILTVIFSVNVVYAENNDVYYTNKNGVNLTEREYEYVTALFDEHYAEIMSNDEYEAIQLMNVNENDYEIVYPEEDLIQPASTWHETASKRLAIGKSCSGGVCQINIGNTWLKVPKVSSYDIIGAMLVGTTFASQTFITYFTNDSGTEYCTSDEIVSAVNGYGCSHKIGVSDTHYSFQTFSVYTGGTVFASYQHASKTISLANSKKYTFSLNGHGNVFLFSKASIRDTYDGMSGVSIGV